MDEKKPPVDILDEIMSRSEKPLPPPVPYPPKFDPPPEDSPPPSPAVEKPPLAERLLPWLGVLLGGAVLASLLLVSVVAGSLQLIAFSSLVIKKLGYGWRLAVFALPFFAILTGTAVAFRWFPAQSAGAWVSFVLIFLVIFAAITAGFEMYYRLSGKRYDSRLDWYRRNQ